MEYDRLLRLALAPSIVYLLLSLVSLALTVHYWITGDFILTRGVTIPTTELDQRTQKYKTTDATVWYDDDNTNAIISSACLNLTAAIIALIAWSSLLKPGMDSQFAAGKRRFYILAIVVMTLSGSASALASIVLSYTTKGNDQYGCTTETLNVSGKKITNMYCTREMGACNFLPKFVKGADRDSASMTCNETVAVKWLQILLIVNAMIIFVIFGVQARKRRQTREAREAAAKERETEVL